ncbi:hypothetical protein GGR57DRAFT_500440 [Xylariaceae sp. FL1272]|nr:hypothetical protein GGR57DRAFT_500440 [Xylariaceae sp. FL1272]
MSPQDGKNEKGSESQKKGRKNLQKKKREKVPEPVGEPLPNGKYRCDRDECGSEHENSKRGHANHWSRVHDPNSASGLRRAQKEKQRALLKNNNDAVENHDPPDQHQQPLPPAAGSHQTFMRPFISASGSASIPPPHTDPFQAMFPRLPHMPSQFGVPPELSAQAALYPQSQRYAAQQNGGQQYGNSQPMNGQEDMSARQGFDAPMPMQPGNNYAFSQLNNNQLFMPPLPSIPEPPFMPQHLGHQANFQLDPGLMNGTHFPPASHFPLQPGMRDQIQNACPDEHSERSQMLQRRGLQQERRAYDLYHDEREEDGSYQLIDTTLFSPATQLISRSGILQASVQPSNGQNFYHSADAARNHQFQRQHPAPPPTQFMSSSGIQSAYPQRHRSEDLQSFADSGRNHDLQGPALHEQQQAPRTRRPTWSLEYEFEQMKKDAVEDLNNPNRRRFFEPE